MAKWFVVDKGVKAGPFSDSAFFDYLKNKDPAAVQIWREGMSAWVPAASLPQLVAVMAPARTARPPRRSTSAAWYVMATVIVCLVVLGGVGAVLIIPHFLEADRMAAPAPPPPDTALAPPPAPQSSAPAQLPAQSAPPPQPVPPPSRLSREDFSDAMRKSMSLLDRLQQHFPKQYDDLVGEFYERLSNGYPEAETAIAMRRKAFGMIKALLPLADDAVLLELNKVVGEKYRVLGSQDPSLCYAFGTGADSAEIGSAFSDDLLRRERDLYDHAIRTAAPRPAPDSRKIGNLQANLRRALLASGVTESQFGLLDAPSVPPAQHAQYCEVTILLFREIGKLPFEDAAMVMRLLISSK